MLVTISPLPPTIEHPQSVNNFCGGSEHYTAMNCIVLFLNQLLHGQSLQSFLVYNFTNMHAMSYRSDFFACSCRVTCEEPAVCYTLTILSVVFRVKYNCFLILPAMLDSKSLNISLLWIIISSKNEHVFICDLSDLTLQIIFDAWWASMNIGSKRPIAWNNYRHASSWQFYLHCAIEETGSPGIICIVRHQVLRHPSIRTCDQLNGETLAGKNSHRKVKRIDRVRGY